MNATQTKAQEHRFMHGDDWTLECLDCGERRDPEADTKGECNPPAKTEQAVVCKFCAEPWSVVHQFVQVNARMLTVSATGELTDEMTVECPDSDDNGQDEWYCRECNARSTNRDTIAEIRMIAPGA